MAIASVNEKYGCMYTYVCKRIVQLPNTMPKMITTWEYLLLDPLITCRKLLQFLLQIHLFDVTSFCALKLAN